MKLFVTCHWCGRAGSYGWCGRILCQDCYATMVTLLTTPGMLSEVSWPQRAARWPIVPAGAVQ